MRIAVAAVLLGLLTCLLTCLLTGPLTPTAHADPLGGMPGPPKVIEYWYLLSLQGQPAGWMMSRETRTATTITTESDTRIAVSRGAASVTIEMSTRFVESPDGRAISSSATQKMGPTAATSKFTYNEDETVMVVMQGGREVTRKLDAWDDGWLPPAAAKKYVMSQIAAGEKEITYTSFDPASSTKPIDMTVKVDGRTTIEAGGKTVPATKTRSSMSILPGVETNDFIDDNGEVIRTTISLGFLSLEMERADEQLAKMKRAAPEIMNDTLVELAEPIDDARNLRRATYRLTAIKGDLPDLLTSPTQTVKRESKNSALVTVDLGGKAAAEKFAPFLKHSTAIDGRDARIVKLTKGALDGAPADKAQRAETLRRFVHDYIDEKHLGVGLASASNVAETRAGDCTEHAVLLAAMLRADGVPSRTASGLMYVPIFGDNRQVFGFHMWTQAWLDGRWVDLDAVLPRAAAFDATHITLMTDDMDDGEMINGVVELVPLIGNLKIEIVEAK